MGGRGSTCVIAIGMALIPAASCAQNGYPAKFIRIVCPNVGGGGDFVARLLGQGLSASLGQQVVTDNRGGGIVQGEIVSKAAPDGYTLLVMGQSFWLMPFMREHLSYDPVRDFAPITLATSAPNVLVTNPSLPVKNTQDLIALAKAKPGRLNYAVGMLGSSTHLAAELFKSMAGVDITRIYYKTMNVAWADMIAGQVEVSFANPSNIAPHIKAGRLRALAVTSAKPSAVVPGLPTVASTGLPGYESVAVYALFGPAGLPAALVRRINEESVRVLQRPDVREKFLIGGSETVGSTPQELAGLIRNDMSRLGKLIRDVGIRDE
jgi:tripartite-type tricarboxylate transporter receptor subunit TctC